MISLGRRFRPAVWLALAVLLQLYSCDATSHLIASNIRLPVGRKAVVTKTSSGGPVQSSGEVVHPAAQARDNGSTGAGLMSSSFNLAKSIVGMGVLALPSGLAYVSDDRSAIIPAGVVCALYGALAAYSFSIIGRVCERLGVETFSDAYRATVSNSTAAMVPIFTTVTCFLNTIACSIMIGDSFSEIFRNFNTQLLPSVLTTRDGSLLVVSAIVLTPLCLLRSLQALAPLSVVGLIGTLFTAAVMVTRYLDGSYQYNDADQIVSSKIGRFLPELTPALRPSFNVFRRNSGNWYSLVSSASFILLSMFNTAYVAHYHAPRIYAELENKSTKHFNKITAISFGLSTAIFVTMMAAGFLTFGGNANGFILNNYASSDLLASTSRLAVGLTLLSGYPILFTALRDGILDLVGLPLASKLSPYFFNGGTLMLLGIITAAAMQFRDVSFIVSFTGALCGSILMFVFPALMGLAMDRESARAVYEQLLELEYSVAYWEKNRPYDAGTLLKMDELQRRQFFIRLRIMMNYLMMGTGVIMSVVGVAVCMLREAGVELGTSS